MISVPYHGPVCFVDQPPRGSYQRSCRNITWDCKTLSAICASRSGGTQQSTLSAPELCIGDIANMDGVLRCSKGSAPPGGSYTQSCRDIRVENGLLSAQCRHSNGQWTNSPPLAFGNCRNGIDNMEGTLRCR